MTCGAEAPTVEFGLVRELYEVGSGGPPIPGFTTVTKIDPNQLGEFLGAEKVGERHDPPLDILDVRHTLQEMAKPTVREGVEVEPAQCGNCGEMTISRIESPDGKVGCLRCFGKFLKPGPLDRKAARAMLRAKLHEYGNLVILNLITRGLIAEDWGARISREAGATPGTLPMDAIELDQTVDEILLYLRLD